MQVEFCAEMNLRIWFPKCEKQSVFQTVYESQVATIIWTNHEFIFVVFRSLQTDFF